VSTLGDTHPLTSTQDVRRAGVIVTCEHDDGPPLWTFHVPGPARAALARACRQIDAAGAGWHIVSISSPRSIYRDLQGTRENHAELGRVRGRIEGKRERHPFEADPRTHEVQALAHVGRLDLLRPLTFRQAQA
jgi:hypothetical protein